MSGYENNTSDQDPQLIADLLAITRYDIGIGGAGDEYEYLDVERDPEGDWVKYEDVVEIIERRPASDG